MTCIFLLTERREATGCILLVVVESLIFYGSLSSTSVLNITRHSCSSRSPIPSMSKREVLYELGKWVGGKQSLIGNNKTGERVSLLTTSTGWRYSICPGKASTIAIWMLCLERRCRKTRMLEWLLRGVLAVVWCIEFDSSSEWRQNVCCSNNTSSKREIFKTALSWLSSSINRSQTKTTVFLCVIDMVESTKENCVLYGFWVVDSGAISSELVP